MSSVITTNGRTRMNELAGNEEALVIDRMILAYIADLDTSLAADPDQQMPDADDIVYTYEIPDDSKGYVDADQVVYSMILGSDVGTFKFNWIGLIEAETDTVITVTQTAESSKYPTDLTTNTTGNMITRNVILSYQDAQNLTGITVAAETWQFDYQADISAHIAEIVDPTQEGTSAKHLTDSQAKVWQDHVEDEDVHVTASQKNDWDEHAAAVKGVNNLIINPKFQINQREKSGTVTLAAGEYGHDRWRGGADGCTYTFKVRAGRTVVTITAGSLEQEIYNKNIDIGNYTLSWTGTAQAQIDRGGYEASGITTSLGGANCVVEFGLGTVTYVQLEKGIVASPYQGRLHSEELSLCQAYTVAYIGGVGQLPTQQVTSGSWFATLPLPVEMMSSPVLESCGTVYHNRLGSDDPAVTLTLYTKSGPQMAVFTFEDPDARVNTGVLIFRGATNIILSAEL